MPINYVKESESWLRPGVNLQFLVWAVLLGVPAFLLFLVYSKDLNHNNMAPSDQPGMHKSQHHH
jgi:hypothetical protein